MQISTKYNPTETEDKWYKYWLDNDFFKSRPDSREPYTIVIPPPNVTGVLHVGHVLNNTIQDILARRARMKGKNVCWLPGTDHASIATEAKVVAKLNKEGIKKSGLSREEFLKYAWQWKEKHGGIILEQLKKLGASCDWDRTKFTMDDDMSESVINVFIALYKKGYIYRGVRMINWDPQAKTAISDEEVIHREVKSKLYYIRYQVENTDEWITIATTRPETILGDTAVCVHPNDERYSHLKGKKAIIPLINRPVPVIYDEYVAQEFGTGVLKITPAHDLNDYELGIKHNLESIDIFNDDGTLNENAQLFIGKDRFVARDLITEKLKQEGFLIKTEDIVNNIGFSERTDVIIEPKLSIQWFCKMKELVKPALENIMNDNIKLYPAKYKNTYKRWMENIKDWCISRQLWWGHRIPAYYLPGGKDYVIAENIDEALLLAKEKTKNNNLTVDDLKQDEDVLDTWFSSWLWPISVFDGIRNPANPDISYYYPTDDLVTAPEILFFWVARMIIAGYEYRNEKPFKNVYLTGIVRDKLGRKMSKSLGNSPEPIELINKYGADGVRVGLLLCSPAGNDLLYNDSLCEQGRNFGNKIWNSFRLLKQWNIDKNIAQPEYAKSALKWFNAKLNKTIEEIEDNYSKYRLSDALMNVYRLFWEEFCSWYLEIIKPPYQKPIDKETYRVTIEFYEKLLKLLHPFMPFITEEIWHLIKKRNDGESIMFKNIPETETYNKKIIENFELIKEIVSSVRTLRKNKNIAFKETLTLNIRAKEDEYDNTFNDVLIKSGSLSGIEFVSEKIKDAESFIVKTTEFYVPLKDKVNEEEEINKLNKELEHTNEFMNSVMKKLNNERFVQNAPANIIERERTKLADAKTKIKVLEERIASLK